MLTTAVIGGKLYVVVQRCNDYGDHRRLGRDGDILLAVVGGGYVDESDAQDLIGRAAERMKRRRRKREGKR